MSRALLGVAVAVLAGGMSRSAAAPPSGAPAPDRDAERQRVVILTDLSNEPDDEESLVRFLAYANEFDVEGLIATTSTWLRKGSRPP